GDMVEVVVAVDQVLDRLVAPLPDLVDVGLSPVRLPIGDRVGGDHAVAGDDEHRLVVAVAEDVDVLRAFDLGGLERRALLLSVDGKSDAGKDERQNDSHETSSDRKNTRRGGIFRAHDPDLCGSSARAKASRRSTSSRWGRY